MFKPGDVVLLRSQLAGKPKYHLCISLEGCYLFLNSPKAKTFPGDLAVDCAEFPFLPPTDNGFTIISCSIVMQFADDELRRAGAVKKGTASRAVLMRILNEIENSDLLSEEQKDLALEGLSGWL